MAFEPAFLDELRQRVPLYSLIGRQNKLVRSGRNWKICCPFHGEKTPSFYIYEDHFHCYGCGVHGDAISFIMQSEGLNFREAVERLANEVGLDIPQEDPRYEEKARQTASLVEIMELVQAYYRHNLFERQGRAARDYLNKRGVSEATVTRFGLGWSGDGRSLIEALKPEGVTAEQLTQLGLLRHDEHGNRRGELFFNRLMFPIHDRKGRLISFGGRIIGEGQPKYVNGPETLLFSKKRVLFNLNRAAEVVRKGDKLVVVEGYMDVIALDQAGFGGAVAPLGTAMGEDQLALLWRHDRAPIICLDGDAAGQRAALRTCELALPLIKPEQTLCFCRLGEGDDPDSLVQREGRGAFAHLLENAQPLAEELFTLITAGKVHLGPEERASIRHKLIELSQQIPDKVLASEYRKTLLDLFFAHFRGENRNFRSSNARANHVKSASRSITQGSSERLKILTALLLSYPEILPQIEQAYCQLSLPDTLSQFRSLFLEWASQAEELNAVSCQNWMIEHGQEKAMSQLLSVYVPRQHQTSEEKEDLLSIGVAETWWHFYGLVNFSKFEKEVQQAVTEAILNAYSTNSGAQMQKIAFLRLC
ncbi:DNA primase [Aristophania vespae]|uniref:DNA primase n=1 Tax=Aristophania vespae TaxID=2697033 RepID=UPI001F021D10|nr:DNA primase [Aristophania vespae]